ncbi:beta-hexosaminidase-like [Dreissena polymorpha]|uniref:beta-hexosaminidase-like n=1 Tax=Dreissena polymorpha TaxID=45954 RepID=UPI0022644382|nr:beta-hexosaminidase-like [Dreissena polymorpha]
MPRWYVTSDDVKIKPRVVNCTASEDLDFVQPFEDLLQRKRWKGDQYEPFTPEMRMEKLGFSPENVVSKFIIPTPKSLQINENRPTTAFDKDTWKVYTSNGLFSEMTQYIKDELGVNITDSITPTYANVIVLSYSNEIEKEGYALDVKNNIITLTSNDAAGMFYAAQTLSSVISGTKGRIPELRVVDAPRFRWRGMQIDVARNFHSVVDIKRLIKAMSMYKMNVLHLHLTDDEGWRLVIDGLPELTQVGGRRCHDLSETECLIPQFGSGPFPDDSGSGYYNAAEYKELLSYAKKHRVKVVPEFDMPGHSHAAVASMESRFRKLNATGNGTAASQFRLKDTLDSSFYLSVQNWMDDAINPCIESTFRFIGKVMDSVKALHADIQPLEIYHFGGDEVAHGAWAASDACSRFLRDNPPYRVTHASYMC